MRYVVIAVLALRIGRDRCPSYYLEEEPEPVDPINVMIMQMKTHAIIEHERQVAVWYRALPRRARASIRKSSSRGRRSCPTSWS